MIQPQALRRGDRIAIIAPSGPPDQEHLMQGIRVLEDMGLQVVIGRNVFEEKNLDHKRLDDLHEAFSNPDIRGVFCAAGGFGSARMAPMIDYDLIRRNPKIFWGYSDITYFLNAIQNFSDLVAFHGPMIASDLNDEQRTAETANSLLPLFSGESMMFDVRETSLHTLTDGTGEGRLVGGNLTLLTNGMGTPYQVNTKGAILLIEEVAEPAFRIDLMLTQLEQGGVFESVEGVVIGNMDAGPEENKEIEKVLQEFFAGAPYPVVRNFRFGHCQPNYGVPLGVSAKLQTSPTQLVIEPGVV